MCFSSHYFTPLAEQLSNFDALIRSAETLNILYWPVTNKKLPTSVPKRRIKDFLVLKKANNSSVGEIYKLCKLYSAKL